MLIPKKILVRANESFSYCDNRNDFGYRIKEGDIFEAYWDEELREYFINPENGKEFYAGFIDMNNCLKLIIEFDLYFDNKEESV